MSYFGAGCRARGASSAGASAWPSRGRTDNDRGLPPAPRLDGKRAAGEMRRGRSGEDDRIGGERVGCAFGMQRPEVMKSGLAEWTAGYNIMHNVVGRG